MDDDARLDAERTLIADLVPQRNLVIATTPTTMLDQDNVVSLLGAEVFHLTASTEEIAQRVRADGLAMHPELNTDDVEATIDALRNERADVFDRFTTVDTTGQSIDGVVDSLRTSGADIVDPNDPDSLSASAPKNTQAERVFGVIIAAALAVLVVIVVLILTF